jgi:hypothetical protein
MKRYRRRTLGVLLGLMLGWMAQGYSQSYFAPRAMAADGSAAEASAPGDEQTTRVIEAAGDAPLAGAEHLVPVGTDGRWGQLAAEGLVLLFVLAVLGGLPARRFEDPVFDPTSRHRPTEPLLHPDTR